MHIMGNSLRFPAIFLVNPLLIFKWENEKWIGRKKHPLPGNDFPHLKKSINEMEIHGKKGLVTSHPAWFEWECVWFGESF